MIVAKRAGERGLGGKTFLGFCLVASMFRFFSAPVSAMTELRLKNGAEIKGDILSEKADHLIVDIGFTVVTVPRDEIDHVVDEKTPAGSATGSISDIYYSNPGQPSLTVKENVERCGDAVVEVRTPIGLGSGFIIHPSGYVLTNEHVISGEYQISITQFRRGQTELERVQFNKVRIDAFDSRLDLALLKIEDAGHTVFPVVRNWRFRHTLTEGQTVFNIGSPLGLDRSVSQGIIAQKNRPLDGQLYIQTTAQVNPGNSGGPLFNLRGEVIGITNMKAMMIGIEGLNFAVPSTVVKSFLQNRDAFAFDPRNPNAGYRYLEPPQPVKSLPAPLKLP